MDVELLYLDGCPHWQTVDARLTRVAAEVCATVTYRRITACSQVEGFAGSPTILVDGSDPFPAGAPSDGLSCRLYATPDGASGLPTVDQIRAVLRGRGALAPGSGGTPREASL